MKKRDNNSNIIIFILNRNKKPFDSEWFSVIFNSKII